MKLRGACAWIQSGLVMRPLSLLTTKTHKQWYHVPRVCVFEYALCCVLTLIVFHLIPSSSGPASLGVADFHQDRTRAQLSEQDQNC